MPLYKCIFALEPQYISSFDCIAAKSHLKVHVLFGSGLNTHALFHLFVCVSGMILILECHWLLLLCFSSLVLWHYCFGEASRASSNCSQILACNPPLLKGVICLGFCFMTRKKNAVHLLARCLSAISWQRYAECNLTSGVNFLWMFVWDHKWMPHTVGKPGPGVNLWNGQVLVEHAKE